MTDQPTAPTAHDHQPARTGLPLGRMLVWVGIAGASAALTFVLVRAALARSVPPPDETADRIQELIDEANRLIKTLDEKKHA